VKSGVIQQGNLSPASKLRTCTTHITAWVSPAGLTRRSHGNTNTNFTVSCNAKEAGCDQVTLHDNPCNSSRCVTTHLCGHAVHTPCRTQLGGGVLPVTLMLSDEPGPCWQL